MTTSKADFGILTLNGVSFALARKPKTTSDGMFYARVKIYMNELVKALGERDIYGELVGSCQPQYFDMQYVYEKDGELFCASYKNCLIDAAKTTYQIDDIIVSDELKIHGELVGTTKIEKVEPINESADRPND